MGNLVTWSIFIERHRRVYVMTVCASRRKFADASFREISRANVTRNVNFLISWYTLCIIRSAKHLLCSREELFRLQSHFTLRYSSSSKKFPVSLWISQTPCTLPWLRDCDTHSLYGGQEFSPWNVIAETYRGRGMATKLQRSRVPRKITSQFQSVIIFAFATTFLSNFPILLDSNIPGASAFILEINLF